VATYLTEAQLSARVGGDDQLALIASMSGTLDATASATIAAAIADVSADIDAKIAGLGVDVSTIPAKLLAIAADLVHAVVYARVWGGLPDDLEKVAAQARADLEALQAGDFTVDSSTPAKQNVSKVFVYLPGDTRSDTNRRRATRDILDLL
jgi:hypothetical protein